MAREIGSLYAQLQLDLGGFESGLSKANAAAKSASKSIEGSLGGISKSVDDVSNAITSGDGGSGGGGGGGGLLGIITKLGRRFVAFASFAKNVNDTLKFMSNTLGFIPKVMGKVVRAVFSLKSALTGLVTGGVVYATARLAVFTAEVARLDTSFKSLSFRLGGGFGNSLARFGKAAKGTIDSLGLMQAANNSVLLGVAQTQEEFELLITAGRRLGQVFGRTAAEGISDLATGIGRQSKLVLDNLGLIVSVEKAQEEYAKTLGKTVDSLTDAEKKLAFNASAYKAIRESLAQLGPEQDTLALQVTRVTVAYRNLLQSVVRRVTPALSQLLYRIEELQKVDYAFIRLIGDGLANLVNITKEFADILLPSLVAGLKRVVSIGAATAQVLSDVSGAIFEAVLNATRNDGVVALVVNATGGLTRAVYNLGIAAGKAFINAVKGEIRNGLSAFFRSDFGVAIRAQLPAIFKTLGTLVSPVAETAFGTYEKFGQQFADLLDIDTVAEATEALKRSRVQLTGQLELLNNVVRRLQTDAGAEIVQKNPKGLRDLIDDVAAQAGVGRIPALGKLTPDELAEKRINEGESTSQVYKTILSAADLLRLDVQQSRLDLLVETLLNGISELDREIESLNGKAFPISSIEKNLQNAGDALLKFLGKIGVAQEVIDKIRPSLSLLNDALLIRGAPVGETPAAAVAEASEAASSSLEDLQAAIARLRYQNKKATQEAEDDAAALRVAIAGVSTAASTAQPPVSQEDLERIARAGRELQEVNQTILNAATGAGGLTLVDQSQLPLLEDLRKELASLGITARDRVTNNFVDAIDAAYAFAFAAEDAVEKARKTLPGIIPPGLLSEQLLDSIRASGDAIVESLRASATALADATGDSSLLKRLDAAAAVGDVEALAVIASELGSGDIERFAEELFAAFAAVEKFDLAGAVDGWTDALRTFALASDSELTKASLDLENMGLTNILDKDDLSTLRELGQAVASSFGQAEAVEELNDALTVLTDVKPGELESIRAKVLEMAQALQQVEKDAVKAALAIVQPDATTLEPAILSELRQLVRDESWDQFEARVASLTRGLDADGRQQLLAQIQLIKGEVDGLNAQIEEAARGAAPAFEAVDTSVFEELRLIGESQGWQALATRIEQFTSSLESEQATEFIDSLLNYISKFEAGANAIQAAAEAAIDPASIDVPWDDSDLQTLRQIAQEGSLTQLAEQLNILATTLNLSDDQKQQLANAFTEYNKLADAEVKAQEAQAETRVQKLSAELGRGFKDALESQGNVLKTLAKQFADNLDDAFTSVLDGVLDLLRDEDGNLSGIFGKFLGSEVFSGLLALGSAAFLQDEDTSVKELPVEEIATSQAAVRGVVAGPTSVAIGEVGSSLREANRGVEQLLREIRDAIIRGNDDSVINSGGLGAAGTV